MSFLLYLGNATAKCKSTSSRGSAKRGQNQLRSLELIVRAFFNIEHGLFQNAFGERPKNSQPIKHNQTNQLHSNKIGERIGKNFTEKRGRIRLPKISQQQFVKVRTLLHIQTHHIKEQNTSTHKYSKPFSKQTPSSISKFPTIRYPIRGIFISNLEAVGPVRAMDQVSEHQSQQHQQIRNPLVDRCT